MVFPLPPVQPDLDLMSTHTAPTIAFHNEAIALPVFFDSHKKILTVPIVYGIIDKLSECLSHTSEVAHQG
jgi:hypothetical protein